MEIEKDIFICSTKQRKMQDLTLIELFDLVKQGDELAIKIFNERFNQITSQPKVRHLPGQHDQMSHGKGGGGRIGRPGMGDISIDDQSAKDMMQGSAAPYLQKNNDKWEFTPERQALHDQIVEDAVANVPKSNDPTVYMLGGGSGTGKSSNRRAGRLDIPAEKSGLAVDVNADEYKKALPEYAATGELTRAAFTHEESSYLSKRVSAAAMERQQDIVLDAVHDSGVSKVQSKIDIARENGYKVKAIYLTRPTEIALKGNVDRLAREGRIVPEKELKRLHIGVSQVVPQIARNFDEFNLFDSTDGLKLLATGGNGRLNIVDQAGYDSFVAKGNERI